MPEEASIYSDDNITITESQISYRTKTGSASYATRYITSVSTSTNSLGRLIYLATGLFIGLGSAGFALYIEEPMLVTLGLVIALISLPLAAFAKHLHIVAITLANSTGGSLDLGEISLPAGLAAIQVYFSTDSMQAERVATHIRQAVARGQKAH